MRSESASVEGQQATPYTDLPKIETTPVPQIDTDHKPKKKTWFVPLIATLCLIGAIGIGSMVYHSSPPSSSSSSPIAAVQTQSQQKLTLSGADLDQAATQQAVADLKSGANNPLLANLSDQVKQELLSGERQFYRVPIETSPPLTARAPPTSQPASTDTISVAFNGTSYGTYNLAMQPISLDMPLKMGDRVDVTCVSLMQGKSSIVVDLATVLNPVQTEPLAPGQTATLSVSPSTTGENYGWFQQEAEQGNPVAEYGLGHMYQFGLGVSQDNGQAIHWYQLAAAQNYLDAQAQISLLQSPPPAQSPQTP
jgi:hypothetical protein